MKNIFGLVAGPACTVDVVFRKEGNAAPSVATVRNYKTGENEEFPLFTNHDSVMGEVKVSPIPGKKFEHQGIKIQLIGQIELAKERGNHHDFVSLVRELAPPSEMTSAQSFSFEFNNVEMQYDSYRGSQARCMYFLRVTATRNLGNVVKDFPFWVRNYAVMPAETAPIKMEVGIEDCLHIEFEYNSSCYHLHGCLRGKINFLVVRIKLKHMELEIRRKETTGSGPNAKCTTDTLHKVEVMDGAPVRGETVPIRLYLTPFDLTPTYGNVHNKFSVKYFVNLVLVDEEDRRYFKQQEIQLFRTSNDSDKPAAAS